MAIIDHVFRLQEAQWDFGAGIGNQSVMCFHQYINASGVEISESGGGGTWEPFYPGPVIRAQVGDTVRVTIQNRIADPSSNFVEDLKTGCLIHWHGIECANTFDGTPVTQKPFATGTEFTYKFKVVRPGMFWYHPHFDSIIQTVLGAYGVIIIEDSVTTTLRTNKVIPHLDRTFNIALSDISFQSDRLTESTSTHVTATNVATTSPVYIRGNLQLPGGNQNFGDVQLINGKYNIPFNNTNANYQQFWPLGQRTTAGSFTPDKQESMAFYIANTGLFRFYKVHLAFKTSGGGSWTRSDHLFRLGGEGGLLDNALPGGGNFGNFKIRGHDQRKVSGGGTGLQIMQTSSEMTAGEFLIPTSSRVLIAFEIDPSWTQVALRVNGFSISGGGATTADSLPTDQIIAEFNVGNGTATTYKLTNAIAAGTALLAIPDPLEDLSSLTAVTALDSSCDKTTLDTNGVIVPTGTLLTDYNILLNGGGGSPAINGSSVHWQPTGYHQPTPDNTRYIQKGDIVEWTVETMTMNSDHPWHIHGFSFQPIKMELNTGAGYIDLFTWNFVEYRDSIYVPFAHRLTFRFKVEDRPYIDENDVEHPNGVIGRWLAHCHIFKHAHKGMMMNFFVIDTCAMSNFQNVDIYMRDHPADTGVEPYTGTWISASPDVILLQNQVPDGNIAFGHGTANANSQTLGSTAQAGQDNYIYIRANNRGTNFGKMKTDVYWSLPSTLVTPDQWNYIGETTEVNVDPGILKVANPHTWASANIPVPGHYCFVGVTGSLTDTKTLSQTGVANFTTLWTFNDFTELIKNNNNVVWRNFDVIPVVMNSQILDIPLDFRFRGAFDKVRRFDIVLDNQLGDVQLRLPNDPQLVAELKKQDYPIKSIKGQIEIRMRAKSKLQFSNLNLEKSKEYLTEFQVKGKGPDLVGKQFSAIQLFINEHETEIAKLDENIKVRKMDLKMALKNNEKKAIPLKKSIKNLERKKADFELKAQDFERAERIEVGRVTWRFIEDKKREEPKDWWEIFWNWLLQLILKILRSLGWKNKQGQQINI